MKIDVVQIAPLENTGQMSSEFSYLIPENFDLKIGTLVKAPFGRKDIEGIVIRKDSIEQPKFKLKPVTMIIENEALRPYHIELAKWMSLRYITPLGVALKTMLPKRPKYLPKINPTQEQKKAKHQKLKLTAEQEKSIKEIKNTKESTTLVFGVTGSGKTEIYLRLIEETIKNNKQALFLIPEIALTPQTTERVKSFFANEEIAIMHSKISESKKYEYWLKIKSGQIRIVVGARSAIFAPFKDLGIIIMDEEQDQSFKQWEKKPKYHSREVARWIAENLKIKLVMGSATPSIESYYYAKKGIYHLTRLTKRIRATSLSEDLPKVSIIDTKDEYEKRNFDILSETLKEKILLAVNSKKQTLILLNRKGFSTTTYCKDCNHIFKCPRCDLPLVMYKNKSILKCNHCSFKTNSFVFCPKCKSTNITTKGKGTEKLEREIKDMIPNAKILRVDSETMTKSSDIQKIDDFKKGKYDIMIGTQMIARGLDLPQVDLVGIINPERGLNFPDFRANENVFELIMQVAGRAGRKDSIGEVILQTFSPEHFTIKYASQHDYESFYSSEIAQRKALKYPPFKDTALIAFGSKTEDKCKSELLKLVGLIPKNIYEKIEILGPAPAFISKEKKLYIWKIALKFSSENYEEIAEFLMKMNLKFKIDINPSSLL